MRRLLGAVALLALASALGGCEGCGCGREPAAAPDAHGATTAPAEERLHGFEAEPSALETAGALALLPGDALAVAVVPSPLAVVDALGLRGFDGEAAAIVTPVRAALLGRLGHDVFDAEALARIGVDAGGPVGGALLAPGGRAAVAFVTLSDERAALGALAAHAGVPIETATRRDDATIVCPGPAPPPWCGVVRRGHGLLVFALDGGDARPAAETLATVPAADSLRESGAVAAAVARVGFGSDAAVWLDAGRLIRETGLVPSEGVAADLLRPLGHAALGLVVADRAVRLRASFAVPDDALARRLLAPIDAASLLATLPPPLFAQVGGYDPDTLWATLGEGVGRSPAPRKLLEAWLGDDAFLALHTAFDGRIALSLAAPPADAAGDADPTVPGGTLAIGVRDEQSGRALLEALAAAPPLAGRVDPGATADRRTVTWGGRSVHVALAEDWLVATTDPGLADRLIETPVDRPEEGPGFAGGWNASLGVLLTEGTPPLRWYAAPGGLVALLRPREAPDRPPEGLGDANPEVPFSAAFRETSAAIEAQLAELDAARGRRDVAVRAALRELTDVVGGVAARVEPTEGGLALHAVWAVGAERLATTLPEALAAAAAARRAEADAAPALAALRERLATLRVERDRVRAETVDRWKQVRGEDPAGGGMAPSPEP